MFFSEAIYISTDECFTSLTVRHYISLILYDMAHIAINLASNKSSTYLHTSPDSLTVSAADTNLLLKKTMKNTDNY